MGKKWMAMLLTLTMLTVCIIFPVMADETVLDQDGFKLVYTKYDFFEKGEYIHLNLDFHAANSSSDTVYFRAKNAVVDGVTVKGYTFILDGNTKIDTHTYTIMFKPDDSNFDKGANALRNAKKVEFDLVLQKPGNLNTPLLTKRLSISLKDTSSSTATNKPARDEDDDKVTFGLGGANSTATAPAYTPKSTDYKTLKKGNSGQAVRDLQQRLTDLGYLNDKVNGSFALSTQIAVMSFCTQNGLYITAEASPAMQTLLYSSKAQYYVEPYIPLVIGPEYKYKYNSKNDTGTFYTQLVNRSNRQIRGYELYYYKTNMWDEKIQAEDSSAWLFVDQKIQAFQPGYCQYTPGVVFGQYAYTYTFWVGVHKIIFDDGEIREAAYDDIKFFPCVVK